MKGGSQFPLAIILSSIACSISTKPANKNTIHILLGIQSFFFSDDHFSLKVFV